MITHGLAGLAGRRVPICIIGAGPVGLSLARELATLGRDVLVLESGERRPGPAQELSDADIVDPRLHVPMSIGVQRGLGGTSNLWGGRCVPFSSIDFEKRAAVPNSGWPIGWKDIAPFMQAACDYVGCGRAEFQMAPAGVPMAEGDFCFDQLERWTREPRFAAMYERDLHASNRIDLRLAATLTGIEFGSDGRVTHIGVRSGADELSLEPGCLVLAAGGLESTRLLLAARRDAPNRFGGEEGALGRYYMGHLYGVAAEMEITNTNLDAAIAYFQDRSGHYVRRRFTPSAELQRRAGLANGSLWPDYPLIRDPRHRDGILSLAYLALSIPPVGRRIVAESIRQHYVGSGFSRLPHILNILRDLPHTVAFLPGFVRRRYLAEFRMPGFFQRNAGRRYTIRFHAEHLPDPASRITLSHATDAYGLPRAHVDFRYARHNADLLVRLVDCFGDWLSRSGLGRMRWLVPEIERADYLLSQCYDGHHQIGTIRMAEHDREGVVNRNGQVFGTNNLFVAGSAIFPTSGEANPTLTAVALAVRLARHLNDELPKLAA